MKFYSISDNVDTRVGMRLAGVEGVVVSGQEAFKDALMQAASDPEIGVILVSDKLARSAGSLIADFKLNRKHPLVLTIPDRHGDSRLGESISNYVRDSLGVRMPGAQGKQ